MLATYALAPPQGNSNQYIIRHHRGTVQCATPPFGYLESSGSYLPTGPPRPAYQVPNCSHSPRNSPGNIQGPYGHHSPSQYSNDPNGIGEGRLYTPRDQLCPRSNSFSPTGREGLGIPGVVGPHEPRAWGVPGGQNYMNQYSSHGRDPSPRPGRNQETGLLLDEAFNH